MSGAVEGVALKRKVIARLCGQGHVTDWLTQEGRGFQIVWRGKEQRVFFADRDDAYEALSLLRADAILELTTPPARSYADGVEDAARYVEGHGGVIPGSTVFCSLVSGDNMPAMSGDDRDRMQPWRRRLFDKATAHLSAAIRLLAQGEKA